MELVNAKINISNIFPNPYNSNVPKEQEIKLTIKIMFYSSRFKISDSKQGRIPNIQYELSIK